MGSLPIDFAVAQVVVISACATFIVIYGTLFDRFRNLYIFRCPLCLGFWVGALMWCAWGTYSGAALSPVTAFVSGCLSSVVSFALYRLLTIGD